MEITNSKRVAIESDNYKVICDKCKTSLILKTENEKSREWWHNCIDDLFFGMPAIPLIRFSGENRENVSNKP